MIYKTTKISLPTSQSFFMNGCTFFHFVEPSYWYIPSLFIIILYKPYPWLYKVWLNPPLRQVSVITAVSGTGDNFFAACVCSLRSEGSNRSCPRPTRSSALKWRFKIADPNPPTASEGDLRRGWKQGYSGLVASARFTRCCVESDGTRDVTKVRHQ